MENPQSNEGPEKNRKGFRMFAAKRIIMGTVGVLALLWLASYVLNRFESHDTSQTPKTVAQHAPQATADHGSEADHEVSAHDQESHEPAAGHDEQPAGIQAQQTPKDPHSPAADDHATSAKRHDDAAGHDAAPKDAHAAAGHDAAEKDAHAPAGQDAPQKDAHAAAGHDAAEKDAHAPAGHDAPQKDAHADTGHGAAAKDAHAPAGDHAAPSKKAHAAAGHAATEDKAHAPAAGDHAAPAGHGEADDAHGEGGHGGIPVSDVKGVTFVMATMAPLQYELEERFYGWRPNDIIRPTDNVNNFQVGVLEVTRRTVEALTERISRTGSVQAFDKDLERARNNLMINADDYMLPSAESSYEDALAALGRYKAKIEKGTGPFYTRTVNLIPLLEAYANLLGSCDDNLVKAEEDDGSKVSLFQSDNYFFYTQGVAKAMHTILQAVAVDFETVIESRRGTEVLHHAIEALHHAMEVDPLIIFNGDYDGFLANHRANLAAHISHARFYVKLLIQTLST